MQNTHFFNSVQLIISLLTVTLLVQILLSKTSGFSFIFSCCSGLHYKMEPVGTLVTAAVPWLQWVTINLGSKIGRALYCKYGHYYPGTWTRFYPTLLSKALLSRELSCKVLAWPMGPVGCSVHLIYLLSHNLPHQNALDLWLTISLLFVFGILDRHNKGSIKSFSQTGSQTTGGSSTS